MHLQLVSMVSMATHPFDRVGREIDEIEDSTRTCCLLLTAHCSPLYCLLLTTHYEQLTFLIA
jgi:hypothetical protein